MKKDILILVLCLISFLLKGQTSFDPKIIFILPEKVEISDKIDDKIKSLKKNIVYKERDFLQDKFDSLKNDLVNNDTISINLKTHYLNQLEFCYDLNFSNYFIKEYASRFQEELSKSFRNVLVNINPNKTLQEVRFLRNLAGMEKADYIVLTQLLNIETKDEEIIVKPIFKLYSAIEERIISIPELIPENYYNDTIVINDKEFNLKYDNNYASQIQKLIIQNGNSSSRVINKERNKLLTKHFEENKTNDTIKGIIAFLDIDLNIDSYYTGLYNSETNQLLAFFIKGYTSSENDKVSPKYLINLVYFIKKSKKWKHQFIIKEAVSTANLSKEERLKGMYFHYKNYNLFNQNSIDVNEKFWKKKLFLNYSMRF